MDRLMERQLDAPAAELLKSLVERTGIRILLNANTARICGETARRRRRAHRRTADRGGCRDLRGRHPAQCRAGEGRRHSVNRGILVDDHLETGAPDIFALGECAEHRGICYGLVEPAYEQARVLARHLAGRAAAYGGSVVATNLKVSGVSVFSAGDFIGADGSEAIVLSDFRRRHLQETRDLGRAGSPARCWSATSPMRSGISN